MEPAVPFAALGATALLAVAAWAALAAAALALRGLRASSGLVAAGCLLLAGLEVVTAVSFGDAASDRLALLRATGGLLLTAGLALGALGPRPATGPVPLGAAGVVVPLGAAPVPAALAGLALVAAAATALRSRRDRSGVLVAVGLLLAAAAAGGAALADDGAGALAVVVLRAAGALAVAAGLVLAAQASLLAKVVATTLAGVLAMAVAALAVVGTVVVRSFEVQASELVTETAQARAQALSELVPPLLLSTQQLEAACRDADPRRCAFALRLVARDRPAFAVRLPAGGGTGTAVTTEGVALSGQERLGLREQPPVRDLLDGSTAQPQAALVRLSASGRLAALGVAPGPREDGGPGSVLVHGVLLDGGVLAGGLTGDDDDAVVLLSGSPLRVTARDGGTRAQADEALRRAQASLAQREDIGDGRTLLAVGTSPTLRLEPLREGDALLGLLAVARSAEASLASQRRALTLLLLSAVLTTALVAVAALVLGRRTVDPVRRLTAAAQRLASGDLRGGSGVVRTRDEVGVLAQTFDGMTTALSGLTGDLRSAAARLETVLASMSDGLLATDGGGRVTSANRAALAMLGVEEAAAVVGRRLEEVADVRAADGEQLADPGLRVQDAPGEVHRPDGTTVSVRVSVTGLRGADEGDGAVLVLRDTTREREVERMKTEFLSNVSHELRTPLTPIRGYAEILVTRPGLDGDKVGRFAGTILSEALKMNRVVDLLVDVASLEAGRVVPQPVDVDVRELLDARLQEWRGRAPARAEDLRRRVTAGLPPVHVDPQWFGKALDELLDNAVKFTPAGTAVTLVAAPAPDGQRVRVAVRDAGPGIAEGDQALLFTSFEQVDGSATRRVGGLGLGLSFVRRVAQDAGFPLTVTSTVGKGTEFALDLPAAAPLPRPRRVSPGSRAARR